MAELALPQMVYDGPMIESVHSEYVLTPLTHVDVPAMLQLVELTHPGPFFQRTIEFGGYLRVGHKSL